MIPRIVVALALVSSTAYAQLPPAAEEAAPDDAGAVGQPLTLVASAELELVDVEGAGGFSNREPGEIQPRRRAPYADVDKVTLALGAPLDDRLRATLELRADRTSARIDRAFVDYLAVELPAWRVLIQAGRQKPIERPHDRRAETYSPLGAAFWRGREWHVGGHARWRRGPVAVDALASLAMQRDLGDEAMGEDPGLPAIAFRDGVPGEDATAEVGGLLGVSGFGGHVAGFAFRGELLDREGPDRLFRTFPDDYPLLGDWLDRTSHWYGGRAAFDRWGVHVLGEGIAQRLGLLRRRGFELGASYAFGFELAGRRREIEPLVRYGQLTTTNLPERYLIPESWDREQWLIALLLRPLTTVELKLEYLVLRERTGESAEGVEGVDDDQLLLHLRLTRDVL